MCGLNSAKVGEGSNLGYPINILVRYLSTCLGLLWALCVVSPAQVIHGAVNVPAPKFLLE